MDNFLAQTLAGITPETTEGTARGFLAVDWSWDSGADAGHSGGIFAGAVCGDPR